MMANIMIQMSRDTSAYEIGYRKMRVSMWDAEKRLKAAEKRLRSITTNMQHTTKLIDTKQFEDKDFKE